MRSISNSEVLPTIPCDRSLAIDEFDQLESDSPNVNAVLLSLLVEVTTLPLALTVRMTADVPVEMLKHRLKCP